MLVDLSVAIIQVTVSIAVSAANMWVTIFIVIVQMGVNVAIMHVVFFAVHYAHDCLFVIMQLTLSFIAKQVTVLSNMFIFL